jgi:chromosome segregation ATPase
MMSTSKLINVLSLGLALFSSAGVFAGGSKPAKEVARAERRIEDYEKQVADLKTRIHKAEEGIGETSTRLVRRNGRTLRETTTSVEDLETLQKELAQMDGNIKKEKDELHAALMKYDSDLEKIVETMLASNGGEKLETAKVAAVAIQRLKAHGLEGRYSDLLMGLKDQKIALQAAMLKLNQSTLGAYTTARLANLLQSKEFCEATKKAQGGACNGASLYDTNMQKDLKVVIEGQGPAGSHNQ